MRLVKIAEKMVRGALEDFYELQASEGEEALSNPLPLDSIFEMPGFKDARKQIGADQISLVEENGTRVLRIRALQCLNRFSHAVGQGVEVGRL